MNICNSHRLAAALCLGLLLGACGEGGRQGLDTRASLGSPESMARGADEVQADFHTLSTPPLAAGQFELLTLSTLPDAVTNGDVLVGIRGVNDSRALRVTRNGEDVTAAFARQANGEIHGLIEGLRLGPNTLEARLGERRATLTVRNHPVTGPVISGPHQSPFYCRTQDVGLGEPIDENCSVETQYQWFYRSAHDQAFHELADPYAPYPDDVIMTETAWGEAVPFVVRVESATINRGITRLAVLDDPAARGPDQSFAPTYRGRVYYAYGESCGVGYQQGTNDVGYVLGAPDFTTVSADRLLINLVGIADRLGKGDVTVHSTLSAFGVHCNPLVSAETTMMIKEHISERYGLVQLMVGTNGSGAALQQYNAANNAPGLLNAAMPTATFADIPSTAMTVTDCGLLQHYYANSALPWDQNKQAAVNGHNLQSGNQLNAICQSWVDAFFNRVIPDEGCPGQIPQEERYHPTDNPGGVRCTVQDANVNVYGRDERGFAHRAIDNVGVQYGLGALLDDRISAAEFLDLNRQIGGLDIDGRFVPERHAMNPEVEALTYRVGGVIGRGALDQTPILDLGPYLDWIPGANIHEAVRPFTIRARLRARSGQDSTQSIWRGVVTQADAYPVMEQWLLATEALRPGHGGDHVAAVIAGKPFEAEDRCTFGTIGGRLELPDALMLPLGLAQFPLLPQSGLHEALPGLDLDVPLMINTPEDFDSGLGICSQVLPVTRTPRMVAGMPMSDDIIKCQLKPVNPRDYQGRLNDAQLAELQDIFPNGVCDFSKPAAGDVSHSMLWPSVGGDTLMEAHSLSWRVARSNLSTP